MAKTIRDAIVEVLADAGGPLGPQEILSRIQERGGYEFKAKDPLGVVRNQLRRHTVGVDRVRAPQEKAFRLCEGRQFMPLRS